MIHSRFEEIKALVFGEAAMRHSVPQSRDSCEEDVEKLLS